MQNRPEQGIWPGAPVAGHQWPLRSPGRRVRAHPAGPSPRPGADARRDVHGLAGDVGAGRRRRPAEHLGAGRSRLGASNGRRLVECDADPPASGAGQVRPASAVPLRQPRHRRIVTPSMPAHPVATAIMVLPSSRTTRRTVGPLAWLALEELALSAGAGPEGFVVETSVRDLATRLNVGKDAAAVALARLADLGLVECQSRRQAGRYAGSTYVVDPAACHRAGLVLIAGRSDGSLRSVAPYPIAPCPGTPCPVEPDAVADTADLPDPSERAATTTPTFPPLSPRPPVPTPTPTLPIPDPTLPSTSRSLLNPTRLQHDTSAPGVPQRGAGSR